MRVASLHLYPVKSGRAVDVGEAALSPAGLAGDRRWMIVDKAGRFVTQREEPRLALLAAVPTGTGLALSVPGRAGLDLPFPDADAEVVTASIWRAHAKARVADAASDWLSGWLGRAVRLVWLPEGSNRPLQTAFATSPDGIGFADGYPVLVTNTASLGDVNRHLAEPVPMNRFRPNIVIDSGEAWGEDSWLTLRIGTVTLELVKPCDRCVVTTTDQETAARASHEPLRTLQRRRRSADPRVKGALFGWNAVPQGSGVIRAGDAVEVIDRRPAPWPIRPAI